MLCRVPVVATSAGAPDEILEGGSSGFLVPPGDASALAATLRAIQTGSVDLATVINRAELRAKHLYSANRMVTSVRDLVDRLAPVPA
jgi:glycosyltransferase involved in cell wall biosynthesis